MERDFYRILGINHKADPAKIKKAYRRAAKRFHPDISPQDEEKFRQGQTAYETLSDPKKKAVYDEQFKRQPAQNVRSYPPPRLTSSSLPLFDEIDLFPILILSGTSGEMVFGGPLREIGETFVSR